VLGKPQKPVHSVFSAPDVTQSGARFMKSVSPAEKPNRRRSFLRSSIALLGGMIAFAAPLKSGARLRPIEKAEDPEPPSKGYQETPHVRTYYEKVRF
jgi:hypothetical protein